MAKSKPTTVVGVPEDQCPQKPAIGKSKARRVFRIGRSGRLEKWPPRLRQKIAETREIHRIIHGGIVALEMLIYELGRPPDKETIVNVNRSLESLHDAVRSIESHPFKAAVYKTVMPRRAFGFAAKNWHSLAEQLICLLGRRIGDEFIWEPANKIVFIAPGIRMSRVSEQTLPRLRELASLRLTGDKKLGRVPIDANGLNNLEIEIECEQDKAIEELRNTNRKRMVLVAGFSGKGPIYADRKTDSQKKTVRLPENPDVSRLALAIRRGGDRPQLEIAREFTNNDERKAQSLLRQVRRFRCLTNRK